ncbi:MAG: hypothetical protein GY845_02425 [Planctomycetes bacterium]|nr:hypothetical protein [Planctomycetota bacterium]
MDFVCELWEQCTATQREQCRYWDDTQRRDESDYVLCIRQGRLGLYKGFRTQPSDRYGVYSYDSPNWQLNDPTSLHKVNLKKRRAKDTFDYWATQL